MNISIQTFLRNRKVISSISSQVITLGVSILMTVGVTRFISVENYGYWQLFIFYTGYVGLAHFGICDGLYLLYGGKQLKDLNKREVKGIFILFFILQFISAIIIVIYGFLFESNLTRQLILLLTAFVLLIANSQMFFGYILLGTNNIVEYSKSIFIEKLLLLAFIISSIFLKVISLESLLLSFCVSKSLSLLYLLSYGKPFLSEKVEYNKGLLINLIREGGILMLSNIVSTLILGVGRYFIDKAWNIKIFGKISLAVSLVYFVLVILSQLSFVLFPYLRNNTADQQIVIFKRLNFYLPLALKICMLLYFPIAYLLEILLPSYHESIKYLILLLPLCLFDGKMQIVYTSYFKNLLLQRSLLVINVFCLIVSFVISLLGAYVFKSIDLILTGVVCSIILRAILSEQILLRKYQIKDFSTTLIDVLFSLAIILFYYFQFNIYILIVISITLILVNLRFRKISFI